MSAWNDSVRGAVHRRQQLVQELLGALMLRVAEELFRRRLFQDRARDP